MATLSRFVNFDRQCGYHLRRVAARPYLVYVMLVITALITYLPGQTILPAIDRTEGVVALSSQHIARTGDWLQPRWGDNLQRTRPVGTFWAQALGVSAYGSDEAWREITSYRLPSILASVVAIVLLFHLARGLVGNTPAFLAAIAVTVTPIIGLHAQLAIAEPLILPSIVVAQLSLLAMYRDPSSARWGGWLSAFWIALGISTWFNALSVPLLAMSTVAAVALWDRSPAFVVRLRPWLGLPMLFVLALPWLGAVWTIDGGALYRDMNWPAVLDALEGGQSMKFKTIYGVFILTLVLGFVPIAHMLGPAVAGLWQQRHDPVVRFLLAWLIVPIVVLEVFSNKPPLYTVQAVMPAGALLVALAISGRAPYRLKMKALPGMFWGTTAIIVVVAPLLFGGMLWVTDTPPTVLLVVTFLAMAGLFILAAWVSAHGLGAAWITTSLAATFLLGVFINALLMPGLNNFWTAPQISAVVDKLQSCAPGHVSVTGFREPSLTLALSGKATITSPQGAATAVADMRQVGRPAYAIIESRQSDVFHAALDSAAGTTTPDDIRPARIGCIRSLNLARGCSLVFDVYALPGKAADRSCGLPVKQDCRDKHEILEARLKIPHCRE